MRSCECSLKNRVLIFDFIASTQAEVFISCKSASAICSFLSLPVSHFSIEYFPVNNVFTAATIFQHPDFDRDYDGIVVTTSNRISSDGMFS